MSTKKQRDRMKRHILSGILFAVVIALPVGAQQAAKPLSKEQVTQFVRVRMDTAKLVQLIHDHNIDFDPSDSDLEQLRKDGAPDPVIQALREARPKPLTRDQVLALVAQNIPSERAAALVKQRGVDFAVDDTYIENLRLAGGMAELIAAVRAASAVRTLPLQQFSGFHDLVDAPVVLFSPDGKLLAAASDQIRLFDVATGGLKHVMSRGDYDATYQGNRVKSIAFSPDGRLLASVGSLAARADLWDVATGSLARSIPMDYGRISSSVAFSPDGSLLAIGYLEGVVEIWNLATGTLQQTLSHNAPGNISALAFSPDGKLLASGSVNKTIKLWEVSTGTLRRTLSTSDWVDSLAFSPEGKLLASADKVLELWDIETGTLLPPLPGQGTHYCVTFTPNGKILVSGGDDSTIRLWDMATGSLSELLPITGDAWVLSVAVSPDGKLLASGVVAHVPAPSPGAILWRLKQY
jgi:WD40 repeat protein